MLLGRLVIHNGISVHARISFSHVQRCRYAKDEELTRPITWIFVPTYCKVWINSDDFQNQNYDRSYIGTYYNLVKK